MDRGIGTNDAVPGQLTVERTSVESPLSGISADGPGVPVTLSRVTITDPVAYGVNVTDGGKVTIGDSLVTSEDGYAFSVRSGPSASTSLTARNVTIVGHGDVPDNAAIQATVANVVGNKDVTVKVSDSIIRGYPDAVDRSAPSFGVGVGDAFVAFDHTIVAQTGPDAGDGATTYGAGVSDVDPLFVNAPAADYRLQPASPAIDAADFAVAPAGPSADLAGAPRQVDGNGDGLAQRDLGAHEYQPPVPVAPAGPGPAGGGSTPAGPGTPAQAGDSTRPVISGLRLRPALTARKGGRVQLSLSERARVTLTFTAVNRKAKPRTVRRSFTAAKGRNTLKIRARVLKARRYRLSIVAVDAAGNRSATLTRALTVRR